MVSEIICCYFYLCSIDKVFFSSGIFQDFLFSFDFLQFEYDMPKCRFLGHLSFFLFSELSVSAVCYLTLVFGNSGYIASNVSSVLFSGIPITRV